MYITTVSNKKVYMPDPDPSQICIRDIAWALSCAPRFAGHLDLPHNVASHSIYVAQLVSKPHQLQALLHDATEAYLCDIPTPYKGLITGYYDMEANLWAVIADKYGVPRELDPEIKKADRIALMTERHFFKDGPHESWGPGFDDVKIGSEPYRHTQEYAFSSFLQDFAEYSGMDPFTS